MFALMPEQASEAVVLCDGSRPKERQFTAGTKNAATLLRLDKNRGTVAAGKLADLVITDIDPLDEITALADPDSVPCVIQGCRAVKDRTGNWPRDVVSAELANN